MSSGFVAAISVICMYGGALIGLRLQRVLPKEHLGKESQEVVKLAAGLVATLTALVLGLLVTSAKGAFDETSSRVTQMSAKVLVLDEVLRHYGPEAIPVREQLRRSADVLMRRIWSSEPTGPSGAIAVIEKGTELKLLRERLAELEPDDDEHRRLHDQAQQVLGEVAQSRWLLIESAQSGLPTTLLVLLVAWLGLLFGSFGLFAPRNATTRVSLFVTACAVAGAIFVTQELNRPLDGVSKVSSGPLRKAIELMGQ